MAITPQGVITINSVPWDIYEKALDKVTNTSVKSVFNWIPKLYTTTNKTSKRITERTWSGIPEAESWDGISPIPVVGINSRFKIEAENGLIANRVGYTLEMKMYDLNGMMNEMAGQLGESFMVKKQKAAVGGLCAGFSTVWNTEANEYLFTASHYLDPRYSSGAEVASNLVTGIPSVSVLKEALALMNNTRDDMGNPSVYNARFILCHPNKYLDWKMIVGDSRGKSDTANNTINPFNEYGLTVVPCTWITSENYWFLFSDKPGLVWNTSGGYKSQMYTNDETKTTYHDAYEAYVSYVRDWRGIVAGTGA